MPVTEVLKMSRTQSGQTKSVNNIGLRRSQGKMSAKGNHFVSIIVLAAGLSRRFGRNKLLEPFGPSTMIEHVVSESLKSKANQVIVVCGHDFEKVRSKLNRHDCELVFNEDFEKGQSFSIRKGLSKVSLNADAIIVLPADVVLVDRSAIDAVINDYCEYHAPIVAAGHQGHSGHPILFDKSLLHELNEINEEGQGLRSVVSRHKSEARIVETSEAALVDIDKQDDLWKLTRRTTHTPDH